MSTVSGFFAYAATPAEIGRTIEQAIAEKSKAGVGVDVKSWVALDIAGQFISTEVLNCIETADFLIADISELNFNVVYEVGYAIGKSKRVILVKNKAIQPRGLKISDVGIFDTLGYREYQNSVELCAIISDAKSIKPLDIGAMLNSRP